MSRYAETFQTRNECAGECYSEANHETSQFNEYSSFINPLIHGKHEICFCFPFIVMLNTKYLRYFDIFYLTLMGLHEIVLFHSLIPEWNGEKLMFELGNMFGLMSCSISLSYYYLRVFLTVYLYQNKWRFLWCAVVVKYIFDLVVVSIRTWAWKLRCSIFNRRHILREKPNAKLVATMFCHQYEAFDFAANQIPISGYGANKSNLLYSIWWRRNVESALRDTPPMEIAPWTNRVER